jgi:hypothetical protein
MKNIDPQAAYPHLFNAFSKILIISPAILREFGERSEPVRFRHKEVIVDGGLLSTHSYFIIDGLIMCYISYDNGHHVQWVRGEADYAYSMDMFREQFDFDPHLIGNVLVALEDTTLCVEHNRIKRPFDKYQEIQFLTPFDLNRVPDVYLASWLDITLIELKKVREKMQ